MKLENLALQKLEFIDLEYIKCPFCGEDDFDLIGLKNHLEKYCQKYMDILSVEEERKLMKVKNQTENKK